PSIRVEFANPSPESVNSVLSPDSAASDISVTSPGDVFVSTNSYARCVLPSVAGTGIGGASTEPMTGVIAAGPAGTEGVGGGRVAVTVCGVGDDGELDCEPVEHAVSTRSTHAEMAENRRDILIFNQSRVRRRAAVLVRRRSRRDRQRRDRADSRCGTGRRTAPSR